MATSRTASSTRSTTTPRKPPLRRGGPKASPKGKAPKTAEPDAEPTEPDEGAEPDDAAPAADAAAPDAEPTADATSLAAEVDPLEKAKKKLERIKAKELRVQREISLREQGLPVPTGPTNYSVVQVNRVGVQVRRLHRARDLIAAKTYASDEVTQIEIETTVKVLNSALDQAIKTWEQMNANRASGGAKETTRIKPLNMVRNTEGQVVSTEKEDEE